MTSCVPFSSIPANSLHNVALFSHNATNTDITSFENCCVKVSGAYTSPEGDCYSHCYFYDSASATRLQNCFLMTQDNPNNATNPNFRIYTDAPTTSTSSTRTSASTSASRSVMTLRPMQPSMWPFNISKPSNTSSQATAGSGLYTVARYNTSSSSSSNWTAPSTTPSAPIQTSIDILPNGAGTYTNATVTGNVIITATGSPTIPPQAATNAPASSSKTSGSKPARASIGTIAVVGLAFVVALFA